MATQCCPAGSEPQLDTTYKGKGQDITYQDLPLYVVGTGHTKAVLVNYDIFGPNGGRTKQVCDQLADEGYLVVMPDYYHGDFWYEGREGDMMKWIAIWTIDERRAELVKNGLTMLQHIKPNLDKAWAYLEEQKVTSIGSIGFCWGTLPTWLASATSKLACGVSCHPSNRVGNLFGVSEAQQAEAIQCPQLILPAGNDPDNVKVNGEVQQILNKKPFGDQCVFHEFPEMKHGWVVRGDLNDATTQRDTKLALCMAFDFLKKHLH